MTNETEPPIKLALMRPAKSKDFTWGLDIATRKKAGKIAEMLLFSTLILRVRRSG